MTLEDSSVSGVEVGKDILGPAEQTREEKSTTLTLWNRSTEFSRISKGRREMRMKVGVVDVADLLIS